jgi:rhodanese-related sulfurtransferase
LKFVLDNIFLIAVACVSGAMLVWPLLRRGAGGPSVNTLEATQMINRQDALVLDVREQAEFAQSHILNARGLPCRRSRRARRYREIQGQAGNRVLWQRQSLQRGRGGAAQAWFSNLFLSGGYVAWQQAGLPVQK